MEKNDPTLPPDFIQLVATESTQNLKLMVASCMRIDRDLDKRLKELLSDMQFNLLNLEALAEELERREKRSTTKD